MTAQIEGASDGFTGYGKYRHIERLVIAFVLDPLEGAEVPARSAADP